MGLWNETDRETVARGGNKPLSPGGTEKIYREREWERGWEGDIFRGRERERETDREREREREV